MANIKVKQGMTLEFKQLMQPAYDLLENCETELKKCNLLKDLKFDENTIDELIKLIPLLKEYLDSLVESVKGTEIESFEIDEEASKLLKELWGDEEEGTIMNIGEGNNNYNNNPEPEPQQTVLPEIGDNGYKFPLDVETASKAGDIFINDTYSLTYFTNYLLDKFHIKDENAANVIYMAVLKYGKEYYNLYNSNPLTTLKEEDIWKTVYQMVSNMTRDENGNDLWKDFNITLDSFTEKI